ncbi:DUF6985 domain-containing protein, partial [Bacillus pseudomycoides]
MKKINHKLFGELIYDGYWTGKQKIAILGHDKIVPLTIDGEEHDVFSAIQEEAYSKFIADTNRLIQEAEQAIFEYYQEECLEYRAMLGDESADEIVPIITTTQQLGKLVDPIGLTILPDFEDGV